MEKASVGHFSTRHNNLVSKCKLEQDQCDTCTLCMGVSRSTTTWTTKVYLSDPILINVQLD